eukprot:3325014-Prymnesium_polylepis.1
MGCGATGTRMTISTRPHACDIMWYTMVFFQHPISLLTLLGYPFQLELVKAGLGTSLMNATR